jgi:hypothetical protein
MMVVGSLAVAFLPSSLPLVVVPVAVISWIECVVRGDAKSKAILDAS